MKVLTAFTLIKEVRFGVVKVRLLYIEPALGAVTVSLKLG